MPEVDVAPLLRRLEQVSKRLAKRFSEELVRQYNAHGGTPVQVAGWQAMIWRYHAEVGMASIASPAALAKAAAILEEFAVGAPGDDPFRLHFVFEVDPPDHSWGPARLAFLSWHHQASFTDFYGRPDRDPDGFEKARTQFAKPQPAALFESLTDEINRQD